MQHVDMEIANLPGGGVSCASASRQDWQHSDRIKRESRHIYNKLHSIAQDAAFIRKVHSFFPSLLLTANLRCGAWYTDPRITSAVSYFKSTDGHTHQWGFSLKRSNLYLVPSIVDAGGAIVVDSTRRGKSMPDALSKTIPIWCTVLNRASNRKYGSPAHGLGGYALVTPSWMIPPTEHDQIEARIDGFVDTLLNSDLDVPRLGKPLKPIFVTPQTDLEGISTSMQADLRDFTPIVLVSASHFVSDSANLGRDESVGIEGSKGGFVYVQGAGDDHENWARGLTPDMFWKHHDELLACDKAQIESLVDRIVADDAASEANLGGHWFTPLGRSENASQEIGNQTAANGSGGDTEVGDTGVFIGSRAAVHVFTDEEKERYDLIIHFTSQPADTSSTTLDLVASLTALSLSAPQSKVLSLHMMPNKKGLSTIRITFPPVIEAAHRTLTAAPASSEAHRTVLVCCQDGKDLSGSLVVAILASCFDDQRRLNPESQECTRHREAISKDTTKRRLQWLVSANPRAAPSRAFLLRVNELLISHRHRPSTNTDSLKTTLSTHDR
ncbi:Initiator tRNA phosphoribosyl transferase [Kalmanozyma brasiliensis GHG001]|uniref:Initiator tRNA phosphoribosyl transferase n=1 Tax=Kalmanozyma brasiliensis (strain GHG001) TaxID=1365824 RepID=UPI002867E941|nr:Initiator tRNA phosphoribosyl transferase [Kalmanozyma brasiliensis GHG001]KAF6767132.1 Initiator tRNA phosphoribosyl transferase [Kalmanozyma brasiliensis GHG001]